MGNAEYMGEKEEVKRNEEGATDEKEKQEWNEHGDAQDVNVADDDEEEEDEDDDGPPRLAEPPSEFEEEIDEYDTSLRQAQDGSPGSSSSSWSFANVDVSAAVVEQGVEFDDAVEETSDLETETFEDAIGEAGDLHTVPDAVPVLQAEASSDNASPARAALEQEE